ncbi:MAG: M14 family metallopeptidase [Marinilabiliaceae bacterium]|nr:M14 family metallopeptidase [Marinilabiliaceae bacterium]
MKNLKNSITAVLLCLSIFLTFSSALRAQAKLQKSAGGQHGEMDFNINWKRYYSYNEWTKIMHELQKAYPAICDIESIGKSRMGREQYLLTISSKNTGDHNNKPAMWVDGAIHGNEVNGITCSLYLAWHLLTRYDYDPFINELVNNNTFYILPGLNVDANNSFVEYPNTANNPREPYRPEDNDRDGLYDEDQTEDVDGDGELSNMYLEDPRGLLRLSADKRRFVEAEEGFEGLRFTRIGSEGFDNDGDGRINEDDIGGPDPNRNYPYGWGLDSGDPYPMSEPETRNVMEFQLAHPNIFASFHYHNTGRLIMFQAPQAIKTTPEQQGRLNEQTEARLAELRKTNKYAQLFARNVSPDTRHDLDVQTDIVSEGAYILKNYRPVFGGLSGQAHAATYNMLGAYSYLIELWGSPATLADTDNDGRVSDEEYMKWIDLDLGGEGWINPHKVEHPDLGEIWIGGSAKKHMQRTPPSRYIEMEAEKNARFVLYCVSQFPEVEIDDIAIKPVTDNIYQVDVYVKNDRVYPTASDRSVQLDRYTPDKLIITPSDNVTLIETSGKNAAGTSGGYGSRNTGTRTETQMAGGKETSFRLKGKEKRIVRYIVAMDGKKGSLEFRLESKTGGTDTREITIEKK